MLVADDEWNRVVDSRNGDGNAFEELVRTHQRMIYSLCYRMTGSMTEAEDLAQETFIQAHRNLGGFRAESRFSSWLYRIALNLCLNWQQRKQRQTQLHQQWAEHAAEPPAEDPGHAPQIQAALLKLNPKQRAAIVLTAYEGMSHAEAAKALKCAEATVSWRVFAARAKLKRLLKDLSRPQKCP